MATLSLSPGSSTASTSTKRAAQNGAARNPQNSAAALARPKRAQVSRACDWCRVHRVKCDTSQPCNNCRSRGAQCSTSGANEIRNLPHAYREIERLRCRVQELEQEIERRGHVDDRPAAAAEPAPQNSSEASPGRQFPPASTAPGSNASSEELWRENSWGQRARGEGLYTGDDRVKQWFGPSSLFYFISRMNLHLARFIEHPPPEHTIHWSSTTQSFTNAVLDKPGAPMDHYADQGVSVGTGPFLSGMEEEYFMSFFWGSYHTYLQIVDESSFKKLYNSLWAGDGKTRKHSALVDIIIALCIQYDTALPHRRCAGSKSAATAPDTKDTAIAGRYYYQRCQSLLQAELECPTISTLQCHIFAVYYLCCASFQNMAHTTLALAVRTAHILGLHLEPPAEIPRPERELRKRIWWTLYSLESKTCIKLGRPWSAPLSDTTCSLPADDHQLAIQSGSAVLAGGNVTWLTYTLQSTRLVLGVRNIYVSYWNEFARVLSSPGAPTNIYDDPSALESLATFLQSSVATNLATWVQQVPEAMRCKRKVDDENGATASEALSTSFSELVIEAFAPLWLQRQRIFLELLYHNLSLILYRPLISFSPTDRNSATSACAEACVDHAIALTRMTYQALSEAEILKGCHEAFQWQWNATITMIGFCLASPASPRAATARAAIDTAIEVFEIFGKHFAVGSRAARVVGNLVARTDFLLGLGVPQHNGNFLLNTSIGTASSDVGSEASSRGAWVIGVQNGEPMMTDGGLTQDSARLQDVLSGTMDVAFSVDSFNSFEAFHGNGGFSFSDSWVFPSE
ncbi:fungal-specific transcription factor domain-containing protein [Cercophora newfieldiana]|uniref:Fungal-specific transcription factor domain-containing protein n=1 Tax=Cercophora newfieldiana TaxID=92897 RepID=A0AA39Y1Z7_9PEZI|nr:fungal-specific transcription factor domain-containing protein [Cercophora newfieldiana]